MYEETEGKKTRRPLFGKREGDQGECASSNKGKTDEGRGVCEGGPAGGPEVQQRSPFFLFSLAPREILSL